MLRIVQIDCRLGVLLLLALLSVLPVCAQHIDITTLGAVANNTSMASTNSAAIQTAIDNYPGCEVYVPAGTFYIDRPIFMDQASTTLDGAGDTSSILQAAPGYAGMTLINQAWYMENLANQATADDRPQLSGIYDSSVTTTRYGLRDYTEYPDTGSYHTGVLWVGTWGYPSPYTVGEMVQNNGVYYLCIQAHTSDPTITEPGSGSNWTAYWSLRHVECSWQSGFNYGAGDVVQNNLNSGGSWGAWYVCIQAHTSDTSITEPGSGSNWTAYWVRRRISRACFDATPFAGGSLVNAGTGQLSRFSGLNNFTLDIGFKNNNSVDYNGIFACGPYDVHGNKIIYIGIDGNTMNVNYYVTLDNDTTVGGEVSEQILPGEAARLTLQMSANGDGSHTLALWCYDHASGQVRLLRTDTMAAGRTLAATEYGSLQFGSINYYDNYYPDQNTYNWPEDVTYFGYHLSADARYAVGAVNSQQLEATASPCPPISSATSITRRTRWPSCRSPITGRTAPRTRRATCTATAT